MLACTLAAWAGAAWPQAAAYPARPVRLVIGFTPGGAADYVARSMSEAFGKALGQSVVVDNKPGNGSSIAADLVAKSPPDGYTLLIASPSSISVNPALNPKLTYSPSDLVPIARITTSPLVLAVHPGTGIRSVAELVAAAKKEPGKLNYSTSGNGSAPHLGAALFTQLTGTQMTHVPYRGGAPAIQAVMAGDTQVTFGTSPTVLPQASSGRLRAIAVSTPGALAAGARPARHARGRPPGVPPRVLVRRVRARGHAAGHPPQDLRRHRRGDAGALGQVGAGARGHRGVAVALAGEVRGIPGRGRKVLGEPGQEREGHARVKRTTEIRAWGRRATMTEPPCRGRAMSRLLHLALVAACTLIAGCYVAPYPYTRPPDGRVGAELRQVLGRGARRRRRRRRADHQRRSSHGRITGSKAGAAVTIDVRPQADNTLQVIFSAPDSKETNPTLNDRWLAVYNQRMGRYAVGHAPGAMRTAEDRLGLVGALVVAGAVGWFSLDKETRGLLATLPTNRDVLFWSQPQRDAAFRALDRPAGPRQVAAPCRRAARRCRCRPGRR